MTFGEKNQITISTWSIILFYKHIDVITIINTIRANVEDNFATVLRYLHTVYFRIT